MLKPNLELIRLLRDDLAVQHVLPHACPASHGKLKSGDVMKWKPILFIAIAIGLYFVSRSVGLQGDAAPIVEGGVSPERAKYHLIALILMLGAFGFFIAAGVSIFRAQRR